MFRDSRQWASSEPSWQCSWPSQRCQSGMQWGGLRHRNWPRLQRPGAGRGGGAWVGPGASVTEPLAAVTEKQNVTVGIHYSFVLLLFCLNIRVYFNLQLLSLVNRNEKKLKLFRNKDKNNTQHFWHANMHIRTRWYLWDIPAHRCHQDSQRSRHTPRCWWYKLQSRSGSGWGHK